MFGEDPDYPSIRAEVDPRMLQKLAMADRPATDASGQGVMLPQTDAGTDLQLIVGLLLILTGLTLLYVYRPRPTRA